MSRRCAALLLALVFFGVVPASAESLIVTLSTERVEISSNFTGTQITLFGAIERDAATVSRSADSDIVVVVRGPSQDVVTRRKERFLGIWINRSAETYRSVPAFYSLHASRAIVDVGLSKLLDQHQLGLTHISLVDESSRPASADFRDAFLRLKLQQGLYNEATGDIDLIGSNIFRTTVHLPANVPVGLYTATVYLFSGSALLASSEETFTVAKSGFEQFTSNFARNRSLFYGLVCVGLALFTGWLAGVIFRRD